jgi:hypothetical protein
MKKKRLREETSSKGNDDQPTSAFLHVNDSNVLELMLKTKVWKSVVNVGEFKFSM